MWSLLPLLACTGAEPPPETDGRETDGPSPTDAVETGHTGQLPTSCEEDPALTVEASASPGPAPNQLLLTVTTSSPANVAATCSADGDPTEVHLVEASGGVRHELRFLGLLQDTTYTCRAVATCPTSAAPSAPVVHTTGAPPEDLPELEVEVDPSLGMTGHWTLAPWLVDGCLHFRSPSWLVIWDARGRPRWWWPLAPDVYVDLEVLYDPATGLVGWGGGESPRGAYNEIHPWDGVVYEAVLPDWDGNLFTHDGHRASTTRVMTLQTVDNHDAANRRTWNGFGIRAIDPTAGDEVTFQFDSQRYVDEGHLPEGRILPFPLDVDPYHANWIQWLDTPRGPELYVSLCYAQQILAIDGDDGSLLWQLGAGLGWTVLDESGAPMSDQQLPQCQHGAEALGGDAFLIYDNGQLRQQSSLSEWRIDGATKTAQRTFYWTEDGWNEPFLGDADDLGNGRALITQADVGCPDPKEAFLHSRITEVDRATGRVASRMTFPEATDGTYRSQRIDGCALFSSAEACPAVAERIAELAPLFVD